MRRLALCFVVAAMAALACAQTLTVSGPAGAVTLTAADLAALPRRTLDTQSDGRTLRWEGPTLESVLARAGTPLGEAAEGSALAAYVVVEGADGFRTVLSLAEADPSFHAPGAVLADRVNRGPLATTEGPLRLITSGDLKSSRSVRNVTSIRFETVASAPHAMETAPAPNPPRP